MTEFEELMKDIRDGEEGRNHSVPMGFHKLNKYTAIRKKLMTLVFGPTGSGKSTLVTSAWILNPFDWYIQNKHRSPVRVKPILFAYERSKTFIRAKWLSRKIFIDTGIEIPISRMLGWNEFDKLSLDEKNLIQTYQDYINELMEFVTVVEGADNPTGYHKYMQKYALANGRVEQITEFQKVYIPNNEYEIVVPIIDHIGLARMERGFNRKQAIDKLTEYAQEHRDFYGMSPVFVAQLNRELSGVSASGKSIQDVEPTVDQIKESGAPAEAADVVISIFEPLRYNTTAPGYNAGAFVNPETGAKPFRSLKILKNTYGEDSIRIATVMHGSTGIFVELPHKDKMENFNYQSVIDGNYFLSTQEDPTKKPFTLDRS